MESSVAQRLAASIDPTAISALKANSNDPAARRAIAGQFGALLMEGLMKNADGSALSMADGVGGDTVSTLYANVMSQVAMSNDQLGLADVLLGAIPNNNALATPGAASSASSPTGTGGGTASATTPATAVPGFSLQQYWQGRHVTAVRGAPLAISPSPSGVRAFPIVPLVRPMPDTGVQPSAGTGATLPALPAMGNPPTNSSSPYSSSIGPTSDLSNSAGASGNSASSRAQFAATLAPLLTNAAQRLGVSPKVLLAQAALESGWGSSMPGNNLFGVKTGARWNGDSVQAYTHEVTAGGGKTGQTEKFRAYPTLAAAVDDYVQLVSHNARYRAALGAGNDPQAYGQALVQGGYATDPAYASKLTAVAASPIVAVALNGAAPAQFAAQTSAGGGGGGA